MRITSTTSTVAMSSVSEKSSSLPGLWRYPTNRDIATKGGVAWLDGRRQDDGAEGLWRIHDKLYDFSDFMEKHPGGKEWLELSKGTDITEAFEVHHISETPRSLLAKFEVKSAETLRNSPYTFLSNGFYATLRRRVHLILPDAQMRGLSFQSCLLADILVTTLIFMSMLAASFQSIFFASIAGVLLGMNTIAAHNFIHLKDNWRRFYFDVCLMSSTHWRITHVLSHHLFPNSLQDLEVSIPEPVLQWLPREDKSFYAQYITWIVSPVVYSFFFLIDFTLRMAGHSDTMWTDLLPLIIPVTMLCATGFTNIINTLLLWVLIIMTGSLYFSFTGFNSGHHHPDVFHDGDTARQDRDWGLAQLDTNRDREIISGVIGSVNTHQDVSVINIDSSRSKNGLTFFLSLTNFGHHTLHHLFPSVDHVHLPHIYPVLQQTLTEFGVPYQTNSVMENIKGQFLQLTRNRPNPLPPISLITKKQE